MQWLTVIVFGWDVSPFLGSSAMKTPRVKSLSERHTLVPILLWSVQLSLTLCVDVIRNVSFPFGPTTLTLSSRWSRILRRYSGKTGKHATLWKSFCSHHPFRENVNSVFCKIHLVWEKIYINFSKFLGGLWIIYVGGKQLEPGLRFFLTLFNLSHKF